MITKVDFCHINQCDRIIVTVDEFSTTIVKEFKKEDKDGYYFLNVYEDSRCSYGYTMYKDPQHGNQKYTWSSCAHEINEQFQLFGTEFQIAEAGWNKYGETTFSCAILSRTAKILAIHNQEKLKYGLLKYLTRINEFNRFPMKPVFGMKILTDTVRVQHTDYVWEMYHEVEINGERGYMLYTGACGTPTLSDWLLKTYGVTGGGMYNNKTLLPKEEMKKSFKLPF